MKGLITARIPCAAKVLRREFLSPSEKTKIPKLLVATIVFLVLITSAVSQKNEKGDKESETCSPSGYLKKQLYFQSCEQSNTYKNQKCEFAMDNQTEDRSLEFCARTYSINSKTFWRGTFRTSVHINSLTLYNSHENPNQLTNFTIIASTGDRISYKGVAFNESRDFSFNVFAYYIIIQLDSGKNLTLCQVHAYTIIEAKPIPKENITINPTYTKLQIRCTPNNPYSVTRYIVNCGAGQVWKTSRTEVECTGLQSAQQTKINFAVELCVSRSRPTTIIGETLIYPVENITHTASTHNAIFFTWIASKSADVLYEIYCNDQTHSQVDRLHFRCEALKSESEANIQIIAYKNNLKRKSEPLVRKISTTPSQKHLNFKKSLFKNCSQSSTYQNYSCNLATDGNKYFRIINRSCALIGGTLWPLHVWWQGQFGRNIWLRNAVIYTLPEARINNAYLITDTGRCNFFSGSVINSAINIDCDAVTTSVRIERFSNSPSVGKYVAVCEIEAFEYVLPAIQKSNISTLSNYESIHVEWRRSSFDGATYILDCGSNTGNIIRLTDTKYNCTNLESGQEHNMTLTVLRSILHNTSHFVSRTKLFPVQSSSFNITTASNWMEVKWNDSRTKLVSYTLHCSEHEYRNLTRPYGRCVNLKASQLYKVSVSVTKDGFSDAPSDFIERYTNPVPPIAKFTDVQSSSAELLIFHEDPKLNNQIKFIFTLAPSKYVDVPLNPGTNYFVFQSLKPDFEYNLTAFSVYADLWSEAASVSLHTPAAVAKETIVVKYVVVPLMTLVAIGGAVAAVAIGCYILGAERRKKIKIEMKTFGKRVFIIDQNNEK